MTLTPVQAETRRLVVGQVLEVETSFRLDGEPQDPTIVSIRSRSPSGVVVSRAKEVLAHPETGVFVASVLADEAGVWSLRTEGAGVVDAVAEMEVEVDESAFQ